MRTLWIGLSFLIASLASAQCPNPNWCSATGRWADNCGSPTIIVRNTTDGQSACSDCGSVTIAGGTNGFNITI